jgi:16S rRNA (cytosine967-C5)-methyltransferase
VTARDLARRVLSRVETGGYATLALSGELERAHLAEPDRALATELVYGVLRKRLRLDRALAAGAPRGLDKLDAQVLNALRIAAHQILFLRVPAHAAVDDAVGAVKRLRGAKLAGFANALLRRLAREGEPPLPEAADPIGRLSLAHSLPRWLVELVVAALGAGEAPAMLAALDEPPPVWLRANTLRATRDEVAAAIAAERPRAELAPSPLAPEALAVSRGGDLASTRAFADGLCTVQDLGAQLVARLAEPQPGERLLDACAGVGGKSAHLAALAENRATIDAADRSARKLDLARDAARRLGVQNLHTIEADLADPAAPLAASYDRVLLDAPCSGLGVLRRHPEARWQRSPSDIAPLAALQARLLAALAQRVRPGGLLVYSVCTFTAAEGPEQIARFLSDHAEFAVEPPPGALAAAAGPDGSLRTFPHHHAADAFYAIRLRRRG